MTNLIESRDQRTREGAALHAQALREICASRGLPMSSGCSIPCSPHITPCECPARIVDGSDDTEGGAE